MTQGEIIGLYESLSQLPRDEQRKQLRSLSSEVKAALWTYNIQRFLDSHPELDMAAQDLLREIMSVAAKPQTFEVGMGSSSFEAYQAMLEAYSRRAERLMQRRAIYESLGRLGPEPDTKRA
jgi:hypothetical protein